MTEAAVDSWHKPGREDRGGEYIHCSRRLTWLYVWMSSRNSNKHACDWVNEWDEALAVDLCLCLENVCVMWQPPPPVLPLPSLSYFSLPSSVPCPVWMFYPRDNRHPSSGSNPSLCLCSTGSSRPQEDACSPSLFSSHHFNPPTPKKKKKFHPLLFFSFFLFLMP